MNLQMQRLKLNPDVEEAPPLVIPNPRVRRCSNCAIVNNGKNEHHYINDDWTCSACGHKGPNFVEFTDCSDCGFRRKTEYRYNVKTVECGCGLSPTQQVELARKQAADKRAHELRDAAERLDQVRAESAASQRENSGQFKSWADACWRKRNEKCKLPESQRFPFCVACQRFRKVR